MLVNPNVQQPSYTAQPAPVPNGVGQTEVVRSDLPPIEQSPDSSGSQNQQLQSERSFDERLAQQPNPIEPQTIAPQSQTQQPVGGENLRQDQAEPIKAFAGGQSQTSQAANQQQNQQTARDREERVAEQQRQQDAAIISQLKARDREVRLHEAAHAAVGGKYAGSPRLEYERGPDGVNYAVSGEVSISVSKAATPEETLQKAQQIRAAATAPAEPSAQDRAVAAEASRMEQEARAEIQQQKIESEQRRDDRIDSSRQEELEEDTEAKETVTETESQQVEVVEFTATTQSQNSPVAGQSTGESDGERANNGENKEDDKTAKEELEEILLGNQTVPQALNQAGLVDTQNPYGKSGFIELIV